MEYPYYIVPAVEEYKSLPPSSEEARRLARLIAANIGDLASLRLVLGIDPPEFARFYPDLETASPSTLSTIDSFLESYGKKGAMTGGYDFEYSLDEEDDGKEVEHVDEIVPDKEARQVEEEPEGPRDFKSLMKERRYREALQFIEAQNLNNPQKSIYFAHQIRFLKKLIAIQKYKNQTEG